MIHSWALTPRQAIALQERLRKRVLRRGAPKPVRYIAGADISWDPKTNQGYAGVLVFEFPSLTLLDQASHIAPASFPYIPGLLSFREGPLLLKAFSKLKTKPDLIFFDGHGIAHPRRFGIASHMGLLLNVPSIGCAKSRLTGSFKEPAQSFGAHSRLRDHSEVIGQVVRTRLQTRPVFVSVGHKIGLGNALKWTLACSDGFRIPKPTREADRFVGRLRKAGG